VRHEFRQQEGQEVLRVSQWAEIRHMHLTDDVPMREVARRLGVDVKTVRRAVASDEPPGKRRSPKRGRRLDPFRDEVVALLRDEPRLTAKRIGQLLRPRLDFHLPERTLREFVGSVRADVQHPEAFVHRTHRPGHTVELDFGESWAVVAGRKQKVKFLVATLPGCNAYFAKAYPVERLECLLDAIAAAFRYFVGRTARMVLDNTSLAVREVLAGPQRIENKIFEAFRGALAVAADFCAPRSGNEKGSVERGVQYVRGLCFRPLLDVTGFEELNRFLVEQLTADLAHRRLPDGRTAEQALGAERAALRPLPAHFPATCRLRPVVADKYAHVRVDHVFYSVPSELTRRPLLAKLFHDRVDIVHADHVVASHERSFVRGTHVLDARHILRLLERKHRAVPESTAIAQWLLPPVFERLFEALSSRVRKARQEWVRVLRLTESHSLDDVEAATHLAFERGSPRYATIKTLLRVVADEPRVAEPVTALRDDLATMDVPPADLALYDAITEVA
jgi:transposase